MTNEDKTVKQFEFLIVSETVEMAIVEACYLLDDLPCFPYTV